MRLSESMSNNQLQLLENCIKNDAPELRCLLKKEDKLSIDEMESLRDFAFDEMIRHGLREDWEPNALGVLLDDLGGAINMAIINKEGEDRINETK